MPVSPWEQRGELADTEAALGVSCCGALRGKRETEQRQSWAQHPPAVVGTPPACWNTARPQPACPRRGAGCSAQIPEPKCLQFSGGSCPGELDTRGSLRLAGIGRVQDRTPLTLLRTREATTSARFPTGHTTASHSCSRSMGTSISHSESISCGETW